MKKTVIVVLACANLALLVALILGPGTPPAQAQVFGGATDYLVVTGRIGNTDDAIWVIDLARRRLAGWELDRSRGAPRLVQIRGVELTTDFRRGPER